MMQTTPRLLCLAALLLGAAGCTSPRPAHDAGLRTVVTEIELAVDPELALDAFLVPEHLQDWWQVTRAKVDRHEGGTWAITWDAYGPERTSHVWTGVLRALHPRRFVVEDLVLVEPGRPLFAPLVLEVEVRPRPGGSLLRVAHGGYGHGPQWDWMHDTVVRGWRHVLGNLQRWAEARSPTGS